MKYVTGWTLYVLYMYVHICIMYLCIIYLSISIYLSIDLFDHNIYIYVCKSQKIKTSNIYSFCLDTTCPLGYNYNAGHTHAHVVTTPWREKQIDKPKNKLTNRQARYHAEHAIIEDTFKHNLAQMASASKVYIPCLFATILNDVI